MQSLFTFTTDPGPCGYLPDEEWMLKYEVVGELAAAEYQERMLCGWRRFGHSLFRPECSRCRKCLSLRVPVATFRPNRSQRRALAANAGAVEVAIAQPSATREKLDLFDRFHQFHNENKGWSYHGPTSAADYNDSFVENPFPTEEWCYYRAGRLMGVGYVDALPDGLSAIYFYYDPDESDRSPGTFNIIKLIHEAAARGIPHVYLGYYVDGCRSLEYKARFRPNEVLDFTGEWRPFMG